MNWRFALLLCCCTWFTLPLSAQKLKPKDFGIQSRKALNYYLDGQEAARRRMRDQAIALFEEAVALEPNFGRAHYELGINAYVQRDFDKALPHLQKTAETIPGRLNDLPYYLGVTYFQLATYDSAYQYLLRYLNRGQGRRRDLQRAALYLRHANYARIAIRDTVMFRPQNLGDSINSERDEYLPLLTADNELLLFTSRRPENIGGYNSLLRDYSEDFYVSSWTGDGWREAKNLGPPINTIENEGSATLSQDGRTIYFTACNLPDGQGSCDIYQAEKQGNRWGAPQPMPSPLNSASWDGQPCLSPDGEAMYFASNRPGGLGSFDIWVCRRQGDRWGQAQPLGRPINTEGHEDSPFLHADGKTLYFSSDFHPGFGSEDLFVSYRQDDGQWSSPQNMGYPLNTVANESNIFVSTNGRRGFINSDREGGLGGSDLYTFELDERVRPQVATFLRGTVVDSLTRQPLAAAIRLVDVELGDTVRQAQADPAEGRFLMSLPLERQYAAFVEASGYLFASQQFFLKDLSEEPYFDLLIELSPIRKGVKVELKNIFFDFGKYELTENSIPELTVLRNYLSDNPKLQIEIQGHTDDVGRDEDNLLLSQQRADAVRTYLVEQGIAEDRIIARGYGEASPIDSNETEEGRARNRRTEFKVLETE